ncbi:hypothetical protein BZG04_05930 [Salinivibrio kushneri]|uniref:sce7726 family protein n=1 Tax=Salinivibrio kushneri TaxID=1908198 RepID=UPI00098956F1|nr:sce7726 family protein [Salinivibrio kushneri]OOE36592.1 hypothetical protein BZG04_05930 [Salinivibrio kushneri]
MRNLNRQRDIASLFSAKAIKALISKGVSGLPASSRNIEHLLTNRESSSVEHLFDTAYKELVASYRNEYVYKNAIAEKIIRGKHRFSKSCHFSSEFRVNNSIADVVIANGTTSAYEIKTEYDSFERLEGQLYDYFKVFDKVNVVLPEKCLDSWLPRIPCKTGVIVLTERYTLRTIREAHSNMYELDPNSVFSCLRRDEYIEAIKNQFGFAPQCKPVDLKKACRTLFLTLNSEVVHREFLNALRSRRLRKEKVELIKSAPPSLTSVLLSTNLNLREVETLRAVFSGGMESIQHSEA